MRHSNHVRETVRLQKWGLSWNSTYQLAKTIGFPLGTNYIYTNKYQQYSFSMLIARMMVHTIAPKTWKKKSEEIGNILTLISSCHVSCNSDVWPVPPLDPKTYSVMAHDFYVGTLGLDEVTSIDPPWDREINKLNNSDLPTASKAESRISHAVIMKSLWNHCRPTTLLR